MVDRVTISISRETAERLRRLGRYGDTMDSIIHRVLDEYETLEKKPQAVQSLIVAVSLPLIAQVMISTTFPSLF